MKKQLRSQPQLQPVTLTIDNLSHEGRGIALYQAIEQQPNQQEIAAKQGKKVFIRFALPDEKVLVKITRTHKRFEEADVIQVLDHISADRVTPICQHFSLCGGCAIQHMHVDRQIAFKQQVLQSHLQHFAGIQPLQWLEPIRSTKIDYRRRARLGVRWRAKQQQLVVGFREAKSNYLIDIEHCQILDHRVAKVFPELKKVLSTLKCKETITHIEFAIGDQDIALLIRHMSKIDSQDIEKLLDFVKKYAWQLYLLPDRYQTLQRIDQENAIMRLHYTLPKFDLNLAFSPLDFTQVNASVNQQMVELACQLLHLQQGEKVLDLFCGLGNFSFALARCVGTSGRVVAVEGVADMVLRGQENAKRNQIDNVAFYQQDLTQDFSGQQWATQGFDALLIDPPRAGAEQVMHYIANFAAQRIVYISCDPATLARDAGLLIQQGYRLVQAGVMDMFTHTEHVESIALFEKIMIEEYDS